MKRFTCPIGRQADLTNGQGYMGHKLDHPERTAHRAGTGMFADVIYQVWPNRASMARTIRLQERGENWASGWKACVPLSPTEGY